MTFVLSGTTITQSGTDTDLSGLSSIAGVTTETVGGQTWYYMGDTKLSITGTLDHDPETEVLIFGDSAPASTVNIVSGGVYNLGQPITLNGFTRYSEKLAVFVGNSSGSNTFNSTQGSLNVDSGGTWNWNGGVISAIKAVGSESAGAVVVIRNGIIDFRGQTTTATNVQFRAQFSTLDIINLKIFGGKSTWFDTPVTNFLGYEPIQMVEPLVGGGAPSDAFFEVRNYAGEGNVQDVTFLNNTTKTTRLINPKKGTDIFGQGHSQQTTATRDGNLEIVSEFEYTLTDADGNPATDVKLFLEDVDSGQRLDRINDYVTDRDLIATSDAVTGIVTGSKLIATQISDNDPTRPIERRTKSQDITDIDDFKFLGKHCL
jgi:hypothetical protein